MARAQVSHYNRFPTGIVQAVRQASVPPYLHALLARLGAEVELDADLPPLEESLPDSALALLKLAAQDTALRLGSVTVLEEADPIRLRLRHRGRKLVLDRQDLLDPALSSILVRRIAEELLDPPAASRALERFAREAPRQEALRRLTREMLGTHSIDTLLYIALLGITSGLALGFNRAVLFTPEGDIWRGRRGIGPSDDDEAHRVWEAIEFEDMTIEDLIDDYESNRVDSRFDRHVQTLTLSATEDAEDEIKLALESEEPLRLERERVHNPGLAALTPHREFVISRVRSRKEVRALLFADNLYTGAAVDAEVMGFLGFLLDATAVVWENLTLLEHVDRLARRDALTGLFNRREFEMRFAEEQSRCERSGSSCSLLLIDVDHFKSINDEKGHHAGDQVLKLVGAWLSIGMRQHDVAARYGGDEFILLLPGAGPRDTRSVVRRLGAVAKENGVSLSVGAAAWPDQCAGFSDLIDTADECLYRAKNAGRGRCAFPGDEDLIVF
ncbi:MAG: GGDEF domain-containing protein [Acidobacteria bacterium]|nr:GGDEF domain-containing protein [Acidobacteriota bacterium]